MEVARGDGDVGGGVGRTVDLPPSRLPSYLSFGFFLEVFHRSPILLS